MNNRPGENQNGGKERAPNSKFRQLWRTLVNRAPKERSLHQDPPQSSNPQVSGIQELPDNERIPSYHPQSPPELDPRRARSPPPVSQPRTAGQRPAARRRSTHNYPDAQGLPAAPVNATEYSPQLPQEPSPRRVRSQPQVRQSREPDQPQEPDQPREPDSPRASRRLSELNRDGGIIIAVMGVTGKIQSLFKTYVDC